MNDLDRQMVLAERHEKATQETTKQRHLYQAEMKQKAAEMQ